MLDASTHVVGRASATGLGGGPNDLSNGSRGGSREPTPVFRVATEHQAQALYEHITDPGVPIYIIEPREARTLNNLFPRNLGAYNEAIGVWWPGVDEQCVPTWHPLIGFNGRALDRLAREFATRHPGAARLFCWTLPNGVIEFDSVRNHEAIGQGG